MKMRLMICGLAGAVVCSLALTGSAQKQGKSRPLTSSQLMAGLVKPQFVSLKESLEAGPEGEDAWKAVATSAALLNESAHVMLADGRCPDKIWADAVKVLDGASLKVLDRIKEQDAAGALAAFAGIQESCKQCHAEHKYKK